MLSLERNDGLWPNFVCFLIVTIKSILEFGDLDLNFQGHNTIKTVKISILCILSSEPGDPLLGGGNRL